MPFVYVTLATDVRLATAWYSPCLFEYATIGLPHHNRTHVSQSVSFSETIEAVYRPMSGAIRGVEQTTGMTSVTRLLKELGWQDLADWRRHHRLILLYKILNCHISAPPDEVSLIRAARAARRTSRSSNPTKLQCPCASHKSSPLWKSPIFRSIPEWNSLPASTAEADSLLAFKSRLAVPKP